MVDALREVAAEPDRPPARVARSADQLARLEAPYRPHPVLGHPNPRPA